MNSEHKNTRTTRSRQNELESVRVFSVQDLIDMMLYKWYWFLLSVVLFVGLGVYYLASTPKVYLRQATILVKDSRKGGSNDISAFSDILGASQRRNVDNELYVLESRALMNKVVRTLGLTTQYTTRDGLGTSDLYGISPIESVWIDNNGESGCAFDVTVDSGNKVVISNFRGKDLGREEQRSKVEAFAGDTVNTPVGRVLIMPTKLMNSDWNGRVITVNNITENDATTAYREAVQSTVANKQASIIELSINDVVPARAENILDTLIYFYNHDAVRDKQRIAEITAEYINERLDVIGAELSAIDNSIVEFKRRNNMFDIKSEAANISDETMRYRAEAMELDIQLNMARDIYKYLSDSHNDGSIIPALSIFSGNVGNTINRQIEEYNSTILRRDRYDAGNNPVVVELEASLATMRDAIKSSLGSYISSLEIQRDGIRKAEKSIDNRISSAPSQEKELLAIYREQRIKEELYSYLSQKRDENDLSKTVTEGNATIVDRAFGSTMPVSPIPMIVMFVMFAVGVAIPFVIIYLRASLDTRLRGRKDINKYLSVPYLGDIPVCDGKISKDGVAVHENGRDATSEAFRILRTNIGFMNVAGGRSQVIQVASSTPHAGKTYISINLALTLAMSGRRVLLVDLDLRRRMLTKKFGYRHDTEGVSSYLSGGTTSEESLIRKSGVHDNLDLLLAGLQPPNPTEMLMSENAERLFDYLRQHYDYIIVDSVPAMAVADAVIMNRLCDICIYVIRDGVFDRRQLPDVEELYRSRKLSNMCIVLNGATMSKKGYGYGYECDDDDLYLNRGLWARIKRLFARRKRGYRG